MKKVMIAAVLALLCVCVMAERADAFPRSVVLSSMTEGQAEHYRTRCNFTPAETAVFECRLRDNSVVATALKTNMSEATVVRKIAAINKKIQYVNASERGTF